MKDVNKYRGCLIGGAAGDALGYTVEFMDSSSILRRYGAKGITEYDLVGGSALISDDTQMTLFTANGLLRSTTEGMMKGTAVSYRAGIAACYMDWLRSQMGEGCGFGLGAPECSWLNNLPEINNSRAPGGTCLNALRQGRLGSVTHPKNDSKGCGGVMRVAPVGLYFEGKGCTIEEIDMTGAQAAAITHGHELGYIPAAMLVHIIHLLAHSADITVLEAVSDAKAAVMRLFPEAIHAAELIALTDKAVELAAAGEADDLTAIRMLGEGWVAEETLAIAIYCALRHENDFEKAIIAAVNHSGDSDSTGSVTGNIVGAHLGLEAIPEKFTARLELKDTIIEIADDLYSDCPVTEQGECTDEVWRRKYIDCTYPF